MFESRATELEYLDHPDCDPVLAAGSYRFMETVNRFFGGARIVRRFVEEEAAGCDGGPPLRILDIGSGNCDIPLAVSRWARRRGLSVEFTCLEIAGHAVRIAGERLRRERAAAVHLLQEDVFTHAPSQPYDCAVASMCFHHFGGDRILELVSRLRGYVRRSLLISDLRRTRLAYLAALSLTLGASDGIRHDGLLSIRRGFRVRELRDLLQELDGVSVSVKPAWWFRVCAVVRFNGGGET